MPNYRSLFPFSIILAIICLPLSSCFTGIESTKKITLSRDERRQTAPTPEESYLDAINPSPHSEWLPGKPFIVVDEKASVMIDAGRIVSGRFDLLPGDTLLFLEAKNMRTPDGKERLTIIFSRGEDEFRYQERGTTGETDTIMSDAIPGVLDPSMLEDVGKLMLGNRYWTRSSHWINRDGDRIDGLKYVPVTIESIEPGTMVFPLNIGFRDEQGHEGHYLMNFRSGGTDSRGFANLFSLTDPRSLYPGITDEVWEKIRRAEVAPGMTKTECRLAKGNPSDVYDGHNYSKLLLLWVYPDATTLYFEDDILVRVKAY